MILPMILMISIYILESIAQGQGKVKQQKLHLRAQANCMHEELRSVTGPHHMGMHTWNIDSW